MIREPVGTAAFVAANPPFYPTDLLPHRSPGQVITNPTTGVQHEILPVTSTCNGWRHEAQAYCTKPPGFRTTHPGEGRCTFHDTTPATMARMRLRHIQDTIIGALALELEASDTSPTDITSELHLARATLLNFIARYDAWQEKVGLWASAYALGEVTHQPPARMDISRMDPLLKRVAELALQLEESKFKDAISQGDLIDILREVGFTVEMSVSLCPHCKGSLAPVLELIRQGWTKIVLWGRKRKPQG